MNKLIKVISVIVATSFVLITLFCDIYAQDDEIIIDNGIPVVYLNIDESQGSIKDMNDSSDHSVYCYGTITIEVPEGFHYSDYPDIEPEGLQDMQMSIRGRGNSTWNNDKKPYKIKLDSKAKVLGFPKNKHWVLLANGYDPTLILDRITGWLGKKMGFSFTPRGVPVDVIMIGQEYGQHYLGSYYLSENVRVDDNRLEIAELDEDDIDPEIITGGYLLQNASQLRAGSPDRFYTSRGVDWGTHTPSFDIEADSLSGIDEEVLEKELSDTYKNNVQQEYIQNHVQQVEDILFDGSTSYRDYIDVESSAKYWLVNTISKNQDAYATGSTYIYKDRDVDGISKFYWGPLWDFDYAWSYNHITYGLDAGHKWLKPMFYDKQDGNIRDVIKAQWPIVREYLIQLIEDGGVIDQYYEETKTSAECNHEALFPEKDFDYKEEIEKLKTWIEDRINWLDENLNLIDDLVHRATYMVDDEVYCYDFLSVDDWLSKDNLVPEKEGYTFLGWMDEDGNIIEESFHIYEDITLIAKFVDDESLSHGKDIALNKASDMVKYGPFLRVYQIPYTIIPTDAQDQSMTWTSSNINIATIDNNGRVVYNYPGVVTFTGKLYLGTTRQFTLTILDMKDDYPVPESIYPEKQKVELKVGEQSPFVIETNPTYTKIDEYEYESDDPEVAIVGQYGVISAIGPGITNVRVKITAFNPEGDVITLETQMEVIVSEDKPEENIEYRNTKGDGSIWYKESNKDISFVFKRSINDEETFNHFKKIQIDNIDLDNKNYHTEAGSLIVTLKADYLETLDIGKHKMKVFFDDGNVEVSFSINKKKDNSDNKQEDNKIPIPLTGIE